LVLLAVLIGVPALVTSLPFGLLFEESPSRLRSHVEPEYDPTEQMSFCFDANGKRIPFISFDFGTMGTTHTGTSTKALADSEDTDPSIPTTTHTFTETRETTDIDR
jgi:hypothetical protein